MRTVYCVKLDRNGETRWTEQSSASRVDIVVRGGNEIYAKSAISFEDARKQAEIALLDKLAAK